MHGKPLRILHADFDSSASLTRRLVLQQAGYAVESASSATECRECMKGLVSHACDMILIHESIRHESAPDFLANLKKLRPHIPVVVLVDDPDLTVDGADAIIWTLQSPEALIGLVAAVLQRQRRPAPRGNVA